MPGRPRHNWPKPKRSTLAEQFHGGPPLLPEHENELLTRVGPGSAMGALMRRYWIPAAFSASDRQARQPAVAGAAPGRESGAVPRHRRPHRPRRRAMPASHRIAVLRPQRGERTALRLSRHQVRRRRQLRRPAVRAADERCPQRERAEAARRQGLSVHRARRRGVDLYGTGRAQAGISRPRMDAACRRRSVTRRATSRNATGCRRSKAVSTRRI